MKEFVLKIRNFWREFLLVIISVALYVPKLGYSYVQPTDPVWVQRGIQFYEALRHGDFAGTYTKYHPGVILMWITGISYKIFYAYQEVRFGYVRDLFLYQVDLYATYSFIAKALIVGVIMVILSYCYIIIRKLINPTFAFWVAFFIITEPFIVGNVRSIHVDALAAFFMFAAVISFWAFLLDKSYRTYLVLTGVFTGLALLTKISSLVLFPFFAVASIGTVSLEGRSRVKSYLTVLLILVFISFLAFVVLFPAMWANPAGTINKIVSDGFLDTALNEESSRIVLLSWSSSSLLYKYGAYILQLVFRMTPAFFIFSLFGILVFSRNFFGFRDSDLEIEKSKNSRPIMFLLVYGLIFIVGYYTMISIPDKKIFRYILPLYPFLAIFASYAVSAVYSKVRPYRSRTMICAVATAFIVGFQLWQPLSVYPNFFAYFNPLLGGIESASKVISLNQDATGYYMVGEYLNQKSDVENLVLGCYDSGPMSAYFRGHTVKLKLVGIDKSYGENLDYVLLPVQEGWQYLPKDQYVLERIFRINNFDYWYLFIRKTEVSS